MITFEPFFETLEKKGISQYQLINDYDVSRGTLDALRKNKSVTLNTIVDLCMILDCENKYIVRVICYYYRHMGFFLIHFFFQKIKKKINRLYNVKYL